MKEALAKELLSIIQETRGGLREGINAAMDTAPDVINEILVYGMWNESIWLIFNVFIVFLLVWGLFVAIKKKGFCEDEEDDKTAKVILIVLCGVGLLFSSLFLIENLLDIIKIIVSPKLYLIDELTRMIPRARS